MKQVQLPSNFRQNVKFMIGLYTDQGVTLSDGFQKDIIQNAMGARSGNKFNNWSCRIDLIDNEKGRLLVIEDEGTVGLTGPNLSMTEIARLSDQEEEIPSDCRIRKKRFHQIVAWHVSHPFITQVEMKQDADVMA